MTYTERFLGRSQQPSGAIRKLLAYELVRRTSDGELAIAGISLAAAAVMLASLRGSR